MLCPEEKGGISTEYVLKTRQGLFGKECLKKQIRNREKCQTFCSTPFPRRASEKQKDIETLIVSSPAHLGSSVTSHQLTERPAPGALTKLKRASSEARPLPPLLSLWRHSPLGWPVRVTDPSRTHLPSLKILSKEYLASAKPILKTTQYIINKPFTCTSILEISPLLHPDHNSGGNTLLVTMARVSLTTCTLCHGHP